MAFIHHDHRSHPNESTNLADDPAFAAEKQRLAKSLPTASAPGLPGSKSRFVKLRDGKAYWDGTEIDRKEWF